MILSGDAKKTLGIILGAGFMFRLLFLGHRQLWTDELLQGLIVQASSPWELVARLRGSQVLPAPLDYFVQKGITLLLGDSAWILRLHAVIFGTLSIWVFFRIARLLFGHRVAIYSTILFTFYPLTYHYSQEGRPFALFLLLALLSYDLLLRKVCAGEDGIRGWIPLTLTLALNLYTSFVGAAVFLTQCITLVVLAAWKPRSLASGGQTTTGEPGKADAPKAGWSHVVVYGLVVVVVCLLFAPWVRYVSGHLSKIEVAQVSKLQILVRMIKELGDGSYPMAALLLLGAGAGVKALRRHSRRQTLVWLVAWLAVSIPVLIVAEILFGYFVGIRHLVYAIPPLVLLSGYGLSYVGEQLTIMEQLPYRVSSPAIVYACLVILISLGIAQSHWRKEPVDWRGAARFLEQNSSPGTVITMPEIHPLLEYYAPSLAEFKAADLDPGLGSLRTGNVSRRYVACLNSMEQGPCAAFRKAASKDTAWRKQQFRGFTIFVRER